MVIVKMIAASPDTICTAVRCSGLYNKVIAKVGVLQLGGFIKFCLADQLLFFQILNADLLSTSTARAPAVLALAAAISSSLAPYIP